MNLVQSRDMLQAANPKTFHVSFYARTSKNWDLWSKIEMCAHRRSCFHDDSPTGLN
jgi:hypothetical protein